MATNQPALLDEASHARKWWFQHLNGYHWFVFIICALGWMFDCADQMIFTISRSIALGDLIHNKPPGYQISLDDYRSLVSGWTTMAFMLGWASGGLLFGVIGDRWGRAKTMAVTILIYAVCTGFSALSQNWWQFALSRLATGFGVGGEFAAGAALVADVMPQQARAQALGVLQALSALGNIVGAFMLRVVSAQVHGNEHLSWRYLYLVGAGPALIAVFVMVRMREPEKWVLAKKAAGDLGQRSFGRIGDLFVPPWRRRALVGLGLAVAGVIGLWGIGFYSPELIDATFPQMSDATAANIAMLLHSKDAGERKALVERIERTEPDRQAYVNLLNRTAPHGERLPEKLAEFVPTHDRIARMSALFDKRLTKQAGASLKSSASMLQQVGSFLGMLTFTFLAVRIGRRPTFVISFLAAWASIYIVFLGFHETYQIYYLYPLLGFCTLLPFGGYAIYFPELFPTRLRTTGTGFCYNVGRYVSCIGPPATTSLKTALSGRYEIAGFRLAAVMVASLYVVGIISALFGPETKGQPLPEDQLVPLH